MYDKKVVKIKWILILIIIAAGAVRLINLQPLPSSLNNDEALEGYDAYSLLKTGKDHRGNPWPLYFEGFSDRVSNHFSLYVYSIIPSIALFGLNEFAVRLPAAVYGTLTVLIVYFLAKEITNKKIVGLLSAVILALSPWHIQLSRFGMEPIMVPLFLSAGIFLFLKGIKGNKFFFIFSSIPFAISLYGYSIVKLITPLIILGLFLIYWKDILKYKKQALLFIILLLVIASPFIYLHIENFSKLQGRFNQVSIFNQDFWFLRFIFIYLAYITPYFFSQLRFFNIPDIIFIIIGLDIILNKLKEKKYQLLAFLFFIFPSPAALTELPPSLFHSLKSSLGLLVFPILISLAIYTFFIFLKKQKRIYLYSIISIFSLFMLISLNNLSRLLFLSPKNYFKSIGFYYEYNFKEVAEYIKQNKDVHDKIFITNKTNQSYIFILFYLKYDPVKFQKEPVNRYYKPDSWQEVRSFDKFVFCNIDECYDKNDDNLYIARQNEIPEIKPVKIFYGPSGPGYEPNDYISFKIIDNKN